jgi:hypothetical protein
MLPKITIEAALNTELDDHLGYEQQLRCSYLSHIGGAFAAAKWRANFAVSECTLFVISLFHNK